MVLFLELFKVDELDILLSKLWPADNILGLTLNFQIALKNLFFKLECSYLVSEAVLARCSRFST